MNEQELEKKLIAAYDKMMERIETLIDTAEQQALPALQKNIEKAKQQALPVLQKSIEKAKQQAIELKEITQEEAEKLGKYIRRDLHDAADYIETTGKELSTWFNFDLKQVENRLLELFSKVADKTRTELAQLVAQAKRSQEYHTGEITSIGTLACQNCDTLIHFKKTSRIPPCPKCHKTVFVRTRRK